jgi:hypothetical protein
VAKALRAGSQKNACKDLQLNRDEVFHHDFIKSIWAISALAAVLASRVGRMISVDRGDSRQE